MALFPGTRLGPYEILAPLGAGGMGEVYRARDTRLGREVAIKVLPDHLASDHKALARFETEAKAVAALSHPNILFLLDVGETNGIHYAVTELLEGETLRALVARGPVTVTVKRALEIAHEIAEGLAAAHEKGIVHRDLKPENVFLTKDGHAKILDFGLARHETVFRDPNDTHSPTVSALTEAGAVMGTAAYMSPEQASGRPVDHRSDQFSLGTVLYEMLAGKRPFVRASAAETLTAIIREEPEPLSKTAPNVSVPVRLIVERCLAKEPRGRYESTADLARELQAWRQHGSESAPATAPAEDRPDRRRFVTRALVGVAVVAVAVAAALALRLEKAAPVSPASTSVLALPCTVFGAPEAAFLKDAVPQTISTLLAEVDGLDTKVPPTSLEVEKVQGDLSRLAELYQVSSFIVTSLTTSSGRFALNVQLVDAATRKVRWGRQFEGPREAYNDLARQAAEGIRQAVTPAAPPVPTATASSEAELAYREGTHFAARYISLTRQADFEAAMAAFQHTLALDPTFARAAVGVGTLVLFGADAANDVRGGLKPAETWAKRALAIDPHCGQAWALLSHIEIRAMRPDPQSGIEYAIKAVSLEPRAPEGHWMLGLWLGDPGSLSLWAAGFLRAFELDPLWTLPAADGAIALSTLGKPNDALAVLERALRVDPDSPHLQYSQAFVLLKLGRYDEAETWLTASKAGSTARHVAGEIWKEARLQLAVLQQDASTSERLATEIVGAALADRADALSVQNAMLFAAPAMARMGRTDDALKILLRSVEVSSPPPYDWLLREPDFEPLRADPRFARVLAASREGAEMVARVLQKARTRGELPSYLEPPLDELVRLLKQPAG